MYFISFRCIRNCCTKI